MKSSCTSKSDKIVVTQEIVNFHLEDGQANALSGESYDLDSPSMARTGRVRASDEGVVPYDHIAVHGAGGHLDSHQ